ncbi:MAG TPA: metalloregulator ArsR/SmtB family transcription factor [Phycicoccus sp.]
MVRVPTEALEDVARRFALLSDPTRLRILRELHEAGASTVSDLAEAADVTVANASQHLGRLAMGGIVGRRRAGRAVVYTITEPAISQLCDIVCASLSIVPEAGSGTPRTNADVS